MSGQGRHQVGLLLAALLFATGAAAEDDASKGKAAGVSPPAEQKQVCVSAHHAGQLARKHGDLVDAHERFGSCAQPACPAPIRRECAQWLFDVEREIPTVVVRVTDGKGVATDAAQVWIDGKLVFDHVDGRALSLDPGAHSVRVQLDSGEESTSQLLLHEGEKLRTFDVSFLPEAPSDDALATTVVASDTTRTPSSLPEDASGEVSSGIPTATLVLGAAGAAALGAALYFGIVGLGQEGDYDDCVSARSSDCASEHAAMERSYHVSDAAWILGAVSLGVGGVIWWGQPSDAAGTASTGFMLGTSGTF